jgi:hypothetical protein
MNPVEKLVMQAALDVAVDRLLAEFPASQFFVFGQAGEPFWVHFAPTHEELGLLTRALSVLEQVEHQPAPLSVRGASGQFSAMVLDAERSLFAVVLSAPMKKGSGEARVGPARQKAPDEVRAWRREAQAAFAVS